MTWLYFLKLEVEWRKRIGGWVLVREFCVWGEACKRKTVGQPGFGVIVSLNRVNLYYELLTEMHCFYIGFLSKRSNKNSSSRWFLDAVLRLMSNLRSETDLFWSGLIENDINLKQTNCHYCLCLLYFWHKYFETEINLISFSRFYIPYFESRLTFILRTKVAQCTLLTV